MARASDYKQKKQTSFSSITVLPKKKTRQIFSAMQYGIHTFKYY